MLDAINRGGRCARARTHVASREISWHIFAFDFGPFDRTSRQGTRRQTAALIMRTHERFEAEIPNTIHSRSGGGGGGGGGEAKTAGNITIG
jgi:hypothetical protein